jgi:hydroxymethylpyrimidine pyrophosphatase-like HAD family hydrolase/fructoselysine-6-P-deglycase FrlB-like protein
LGKPYASELAQLPLTYKWARSCDITSLARSVQVNKEFPLISVGSGGSLTAAAFMAQLHEDFTGMPAKYCTPLEVIEDPAIRECAVYILSARGTNPDIVEAGRLIAYREPKAVSGIVLANESPLSGLSQQFPWIDIISIESPAGKDGFLATNSLLGIFVLLYRAYCSVYGIEPELPETMPEAKVDTFDNVSVFQKQQFEQGTICTLFGGWAKAPAIDFESKFTEAGLSSVQLADFRNFSHGRHYWLVRHPKTTVVALITPELRSTATRTISALPVGTKVIKAEASSIGPVGAIELLVSVLKITGEASVTLGIDVGKPSVPSFGRRLYHQGFSKKKTSTIYRLDYIIERKLGGNLHNWPEKALIAARESLDEFLRRLVNIKIGGIALDYDGTLCPIENRYGGLPESAAQLLSDLLEKGLLVGIATGRGKSVRQALSKTISSKYLDRIIVGYYNGSQVLNLNEGDPVSGDAAIGNLMQFVDLIQSDPLFPEVCRIEVRPQQVTLTPQSSVPSSLLYEMVNEILALMPECGLKTSRSGHSIDVIPNTVSKLAVKAKLQELLAVSGSAMDVLCIGDSGSWDGNDFFLLSDGHGLSVDRVCHNINHAWNIAPPGHRGLQATLDYLKALKLNDGAVSLDVSTIIEVHL